MSVDIGHSHGYDSLTIPVTSSEVETGSFK